MASEDTGSETEHGLFGMHFKEDARSALARACVRACVSEYTSVLQHAFLNRSFVFVHFRKLPLSTIGQTVALVRQTRPMIDKMRVLLSLQMSHLCVSACSLSSFQDQLAN